MDVPASDFQNAPLASLQRIDAATEKLSHVSIGGVPCIYLNDPNLIGAVLSTNWPRFRKEFGYKKSRDYIQNDLFSPEIVWPSAQEFVTVSAELQHIVEEYLAKGGRQIDDLFAWCRRLTMEIFLRTLLVGSIAPSISQQELEDATMRTIEVLGKEILKFPENIDMIDELDTESHLELRNYAKMFLQNPDCSHATVGRAITTILAGYEQMAAIMYWLILHYAKRPLTDMAGVGNRQFLNEVIRLHSPIWTIMRRPKEDVRIEDHILPRESVVITSPWLMARNTTYFPAPDTFQPARWNQQIDTFAFFPFSHGPRVCKGERFVRAAMYALLDELGRKGLHVDATEDEGHLINVSATPKGRRRVTFSSLVTA